MTQRPYSKGWINKFRVALRGVLMAMRTQDSFKVHLVSALVVIGAAMALKVDRTEACILALCITGVLCAEAFNTSLEHLARAVTRQPDEEVGRALDVAAGAVLLASLGSAVVGVAVLFIRLCQILAE